jgi:hypothetical protein
VERVSGKDDGQRHRNNLDTGQQGFHVDFLKAYRLRNDSIGRALNALHENDWQATRIWASHKLRLCLVHARLCNLGRAGTGS